MSVLFLSTPSARRATRSAGSVAGWSSISIHALREEGDCPSWAAVRVPKNFYPRPPRGGRHPSDFYPYVRLYISIHALREEGDAILSLTKWRYFCISIHALREEGDIYRVSYLTRTKNFYPRPPRGGRPPHGAHRGMVILFLSTPSARRATSLGIATIYYAEISIHALREEGDGGPDTTALTDEISIHALREEGDVETRSEECFQNISIHALREEGDRCPLPPVQHENQFLSTPSARRAT